ncbi:MAG: hypothetical protein Q9219_004122 [cf. Caloplaca sp. 3 TL-2023]
MADENPLLTALPPALDYLSYLTILEYNLTPEQLPVLHDILQDTTLTANIGWDLVHLLLPLLPQSRSCLQDVARLGNPREVVLKATELLEALANPDETEDEDQRTDGSSDNEQAAKEQAEGTLGNECSTASHTSITASPGQRDRKNPPSSPSKVTQFCALVDMLTVLHPRIKTKHPSRFLSTSLEALLSAYATLLADDTVTDAVLQFIKSFAGSKRPRLPPRKSSTQIPVWPPSETLASAPDPEANGEPVAPEETALQQRLLQSFLTFISEGYVSSLPSEEDMVAFSWSSRLQEQSHPEKSVPGRRRMGSAFKEDETLHHRDSIMGQILALSRDLELLPDDFVRALVRHEDPLNEDTDDLPSSASDVPLSRPGCLHLLCATITSNVFFHAPSTIPNLSIFPILSSILANLLSDPSSGSIGTESLPIIDSLLFLGSYIFETSGLGQLPEDEMVFTDTLQRLSLMSANTPSGPLRYHAHILTSSLLHAHPTERLRLSIIQDTLEHCSYENLKASAVGWLKDEILAANAPLHGDPPPGTTPDHEQTSIFASSVCIESLSSHLFLNPSHMSNEEFRAHQPFFLAVLNLYYLILASPTVCDSIGIRVIDEAVGYSGTDDWLTDMEGCVAVQKKERLGEDGQEELVLLEAVMAMCEEKMVPMPR